MKKIRLEAVIIIEDGAEADLIMDGQERAEAMGGDPNMLTTIEGAFIEFFALIDHEGQDKSVGFTVESIEAFELCRSIMCNRRIHP